MNERNLTRLADSLQTVRILKGVKALDDCCVEITQYEKYLIKQIKAELAKVDNLVNTFNTSGIQTI